MPPWLSGSLRPRNYYICNNHAAKKVGIFIEFIIIIMYDRRRVRRGRGFRRGRTLTEHRVSVRRSTASSQQVPRRRTVLSPSVVCAGLPGVRLVLCGVMELDRMDENDWKYHGEGNKSLVVSHVQVNKLS